LVIPKTVALHGTFLPKSTVGKGEGRSNFTVEKPEGYNLDW
jgi:hypothetical protein